MASERRYIALSEKEFESALNSYRRTNPNFLPNGELANWEVGPGDSINVAMAITGGASTQTITFPLDASQVVAILVRFCIENNIPVPRAGTKTWMKQDACVVLSISMDGNELTCFVGETAELA